jgi:branched-chain amino acid transport system ATP-binding protein
VLLVEQNAHHGLRISARAYVLAQGRVCLSGASAELVRNADVRASYLEGGLAPR